VEDAGALDAPLCEEEGAEEEEAAVFAEFEDAGVPEADIEVVAEVGKMRDGFGGAKSACNS